jgi:RNA polymerase sigma factor (sigma-70 family)
VARVRRNERPGDDAVRAAARVFEEYGGFIRAVIHYQTHHKSEEEDLFQEFFLTLIRKPVPSETRNIKSYLYQAITHHIVDSSRRWANYRQAVKRYVQKIGIPINTDASGSAFIENSEEKDAILAYFARHLQQREAQAFLLRYRDHFSIREIAAAMGVNVRTVSRYLSEGLRRLRETLAT